MPPATGTAAPGSSLTAMPSLMPSGSVMTTSPAESPLVISTTVSEERPVTTSRRTATPFSTTRQNWPPTSVLTAPSGRLSTFFASPVRITTFASMPSFRFSSGASRWILAWT